MTRRTAGLAAALALGLAAPAAAAPPQLNATSPLGVQKGVEAELTITGANLSGHPELIAPFGFAVSPTSAPGGDAANWKLKLTVAPETPLGAYPIRVKTDDGLSNPVLVSVGQLPQVAEAEDNSTFEAAQPVPAPAVVEGQASGNDVDYFRFPGKKGQRIVVDAQCARIGSGVDPTIRLTTAGRVYVASADDSPGLITDARLTATLPEDTDYVVEISDSRYQGGNRPVYRLVIGEVPVADEIFPIGGRRGETVGIELRGGTLPDLRLASARIDPAPGVGVAPVRITSGMVGLPTGGGPGLEVESLAPLAAGDLPELREPADPAAPPIRAAVPVALNGRIDPAGDEDRFTLAVTPGQALRIEVEAAESGSALDGVLQVLGANNAVLANADDTPLPPPPAKKGAKPVVVSFSPDPSLDYTVPAGTGEITLALRDLEARGGVGFPYRITVRPVTPRFEIALSDPQASLPRGGSTALAVTVTRKGYTGPITLNVPNPPAGVAVRPGTIAEGQTTGVLSLSAGPDAAFGATYVEVVGQGQGPSGPIVASASKPIVFATQGTLPTNTVVQLGLAMAPALPPAVALDAPGEPIEVVHGFGAAIPIKLKRSEGADPALAVSPLPLPPGLAVPAANLAEKATEGSVTVNAAVETPLGAMTIGLVAKGKVGGAEQTFAAPAVTLNVVRPVTLELGAPTLEAKAGATTELKGKVVRKGPFKDPVTVKVVGLPAGLKAEPVTVGPEQSEFTAPIVADEKAAAAEAKANVQVAFQVNKKDYNTPAVALAVKVVPAK